MLICLTAFNVSILSSMCVITGNEYRTPYVVSLASLLLYLLFVALATPKELGGALSFYKISVPKTKFWQFTPPKLWSSLSHIYTGVVTIATTSIFLLFALTTDTEKNVRNYQYETAVTKWFISFVSTIGNPDKVGSYLLANGRELMLSGNLSLAEKYLLAAMSFAEAHRQTPCYIEACLQLSQLFTKLHAYGAAQVSANKALALTIASNEMNKSIKDTFANIGNDQLAAYAQLYTILVRTNKFLDASRICQKALLIAHYDSDKDTWLKNLAFCYLNSGRAVDAEKIYQILLKKVGTQSTQTDMPEWALQHSYFMQDKADMYWSLAKIQLERDHAIESLKSLDKAIDLEMKNSDANRSSYLVYSIVEMLNRKINMLESLGDVEKIKEVEQIRDKYLLDHSPFFNYDNGKYYLSESTCAQIQNEAVEATRVLLERKSTYYFEEISILEKHHATPQGIKSMKQSGLLPNNIIEIGSRREKLASDLIHDRLLIRKIDRPQRINNDTVTCTVFADLWSVKTKDAVPCHLKYTFLLDPKALTIKINQLELLNQFVWTS